MIATVFGRIRKIRENGGDGVQKIWQNLGTNNLWKRIIKNVIATTVVGMPPFSRLLYNFG